MERKKRSKGRGWKSCYVKKFYGTFGVEMRSYGQKLVKLCTHTHTHTSVSYSSIDIIKFHHVAHTHLISADISLLVKSRRKILLYRTRSNSFTNCASRVTSNFCYCAPWFRRMAIYSSWETGQMLLLL